VRRDDASKTPVPLAGVVPAVGRALNDAQEALLRQAQDFRAAHSVVVASVDAAIEAAQSGFAVLPWSAVGAEGEDRLAASSVTVRCLQRPDGSLSASADEADLQAVCGRAY
jgi:prolyl-tRNA synthetase